ncbi:uncharacterized protein TRAVEDRAFT_31713, partial [Trametes versicolor FP-101664 SS1]|uniref:uncharacterized protein n=1 Tax=Trametes versicolor (strain FP-101664) TaxID=717944 RepID=UPI0004623D6E
MIDPVIFCSIAVAPIYYCRTLGDLLSPRCFGLPGAVETSSHVSERGAWYSHSLYTASSSTVFATTAMSSPLTFLSESVGPSLDEEEPPLDSIYGAFLIGNFVGLLLYGAILHQAYHYARTYPQDQLALKCVVVATVLLETCSSILGIHSCYFSLISIRSLPLSEVLTMGIWSLNLFPLVLGLAIVTSQSFFIRRLWILGSRPYKAAVIFSGLCSLAVLGLCTAATAESFIINDGDKTRPTLAELVSKAFLLALIADGSLTIMLIHVLHRSRTGIKSTDSTINILIIYSVRTGLLTGVFDLITTIFAFVRPGDNVYIAFGLPGARMYTITLLSALNSRQWIADRASSAGDASVFGTTVLNPMVFSPMQSGHRPTRSAGLATTNYDSNAIELDVIPQPRRHTSRPLDEMVKSGSSYTPQHLRLAVEGDV